MQSRTISIPMLAAIGGTRGLLGVGLGLLISSRLSASRRDRVGKSLLALGLLSTIPLLLYVFRSPRGRESVFSAPAPLPETKGLYGKSRMVSSVIEPPLVVSEPRSGGAVDGSGKHHRVPPPTVRGLKNDHSIAKGLASDNLRRRGHGGMLLS